MRSVRAEHQRQVPEQREPLAMPTMFRPRRSSPCMTVMARAAGALAGSSESRRSRRSNDMSELYTGRERRSSDSLENGAAVMSATGTIWSRAFNQRSPNQRGCGEPCGKLTCTLWKVLWRTCGVPEESGGELKGASDRPAEGSAETSLWRPVGNWPVYRAGATVRRLVGKGEPWETGRNPARWAIETRFP